jgi:hypothetical protein
MLTNKSQWKSKCSSMHNSDFKPEKAYDGSYVSEASTFHSKAGNAYPFIEIQLDKEYDIFGGNITARSSTAAYRSGYWEVMNSKSKVICQNMFSGNFNQIFVINS